MELLLKKEASLIEALRETIEIMVNNKANYRLIVSPKGVTLYLYKVTPELFDKIISQILLTESIKGIIVKGRLLTSEDLIIANNKAKTRSK